MKEREASISEMNSKVQLLPLGSVYYPSLWRWLCELVGVEGKQLCVPAHRDPQTVMEELSEERETEVKKEEDEVEKMDIDVIADVQSSTSTTLKEKEEQQESTMSSLPEVPRPIGPPSVVMTKTQRVQTHEIMEAILTEPPPARDTTTTTIITHSEPVTVSESSSYCETQPSTSGVKHELLLARCLYGVSVCAVRCPAYFKPLYRLAKTLMFLGLPKVILTCT